MNARTSIRLPALFTAALLAAWPFAAAQSASSIIIVGRDRTAHVVGERSGIEIVLDFGAWPAVPTPSGTIRIGDPSWPEADCIITLPAQPPLGCLWGVDTPGDYQLVAAYSGDASYAPLVSPAVTHTVLAGAQPERVSLADPPVADRNAASPSRHAVMSADGRWIAFLSAEQRLTDNPQGAQDTQAMLFDRRTGLTRRMSNAPSGTPANLSVERVAISGDGRFVAFMTTASNLVADDTPGTPDWFVADREGGGVQLLPALRPSTGDSLQDSVALSFDGRYVAFSSLRSDLVVGDTNGTYDVFRLDRDNGTIVLVSRTLTGLAGAGVSLSPSISADGRLVAFYSSTTDLVPGDTNWRTDVFVRDLEAGITERVSLADSGAQVVADAYTPAISATGRYVAFVAEDGFVAGDNDSRPDIFVRDRIGATTTWVSPNPPSGSLGRLFGPTVSNDGSRVAFRSFTPDRLHLFDAASQSVATLGEGGLGIGAPMHEGVPSSLQLSADGRSVVFDSGLAGLVADDRNRASDVFVQDLSDGSVQRVSGIRLTGAGSNDSFGPVELSDDGAVVAFSSFAGNLVPGDINGAADIFVRDRRVGRTERVSQRAGSESSAIGVWPNTLSLSGDGRLVVFTSPAPNLVPGDTGDAGDIFMHDRLDGSLRMLSRRSDGLPSMLGSHDPSMSRDGRWVAFTSRESHLMSPPLQGHNVYLHDTLSNTTTVVPPGVQGSSETIVTAPRLSGDGRYMVFTSTSGTLVPNDTNGVADVFLYDRVANSMRLISVSATGEPANQPSSKPEISADGQRVAFLSLASNLVPGDTNGKLDVFVVSLPDGEITRANVGPGGSQSTGDWFGSRPSLSGDGRYVVFQSAAMDLVSGAGPAVDVYVRDLTQGRTRRALSRPPANTGFRASAGAISTDGRTIALLGPGQLAAGGAQGAIDVFVTENPFLSGQLLMDGFEEF